MESSLIFQTIGILIMALGSILAIEGLRDRIKKSVKVTEKEVKKLSLIFLITWILGWIVIEYKKKKENLLQKKKEGKLSDITAFVKIYFVWILLTFPFALKLQILKTLERYILHLGLSFIAFGATIQIVGLWV